MSKDLDEQIKLAHKVADAVDRANRMTCLTLRRYNVVKPNTSYAPVRVLAGKFQQIVYVNHKLEEFIYLLDVMSFVYSKVITNQPICNVQ